MKKNETHAQIMAAVAAAEAKKAENVSILELDKASGSFTDYFVICSGSNPRQIQAISDEVEEQLTKATGQKPTHVEGYSQAEWVLLDYVDFVVHIFSEKARQFYDLERLWKSAKRLDAHALKAPEKRKAAPRKQASPPAATSSRAPRTRSPRSRKPA
jgi:ribosome-associated protein